MDIGLVHCEHCDELVNISVNEKCNCEGALVIKPGKEALKERMNTAT
jgi:hypothetical protein